jgi:DMSO reductase family type II enzyme heme b subunit
MGREIGAVGSVSVSSVHDGSVLAFRLEWADAEEDAELSDTTSFPDGAAVLLPSVPGAPAMTMGAPGSAVTAWYWRADDAGGRGRHVVAEGLGTTRMVDEESVRSRGEWKEGRWRVVLARPLRVESGEPVAQLEVGAVTGFGVAVWEGSQGERAGIKAFSGDWQELRIESPATARR